MSQKKDLVSPGQSTEFFNKTFLLTNDQARPNLLTFGVFLHFKSNMCFSQIICDGMGAVA